MVNNFVSDPVRYRTLQPLPQEELVESDGNIKLSHDSPESSFKATDSQSGSPTSSQEIRAEDSPFSAQKISAVSTKAGLTFSERVSKLPVPGNALIGTPPLQRSSAGNGGWKRTATPVDSSTGQPGNQPILMNAAQRQRSSDISEESNVPSGKNINNMSDVPPKEQVYTLSNPSPEEMRKICEELAQNPVFTSHYDFRIQKVTHEIMSQSFKSAMGYINLADTQAVKDSWKGLQESEIRKGVLQSFESKQSRIDKTNIVTVRAYHATKKKYLEIVLAQGVRFMQTTDPGYFGCGPYYSTRVDYCTIYGGRQEGVMLICKVFYRSGALFPASSCDVLKGQAIRTGFDAHGVHVVPKTKNPAEMIYVSSGPTDEPWQKERLYDEIVLRDSSQGMIEYVMEYKAKGLFLSQISEKRTGKDLKNSIESYLEKNPPQADLYQILERKLEDNRPLTRTLDQEEEKLLALLQHSIGEKDGKTLEGLEKRLQGLLDHDDFLPSGYIKMQEAKEANDDNIQIGGEFLRKKNYPKALAAYKEALSKCPDSFSANVGCGSACFHLKDWNNVIVYFKKALKIKPKDKEAILNYVFASVTLAKESIKQGNYVEAAKGLMDALDYDPSNLEMLGLMASLCLSQDCPKPAYRFAIRALLVNPRDVIALRVRGSVYAGWGKTYYDQAMKDLSESLENQTKLLLYNIALINRARLYLSKNNFKEALNDCSLLLNRDPKDIDGLMIRATIAFRQKQLSKGEMQKQFKLADKDLAECDKMSHKMSPKKYAIQALFGELWVQKNDMTKALKYFNLSVQYFQDLTEDIQEAKKADLYGILLQRAEVYRRKNDGTGCS